MSRPPVEKESPILTVAVSSRALFDFEEENRIFEKDGEAAYMQKQYEQLDTAVAAGIAFPMVQKLLALNTPTERLVDVIVLSRNDPTTGLRVFRTISEHKLDIRRGCFTRGSAALPYLGAFKAHLFLSADLRDVHDALANGFAAAQVLGSSNPGQQTDDTLRIAFDGDAVLFGDDAERVYQEHGLDEFHKQEKQLAERPLPAGPIKPFLDALHNLGKKLPSGKIRTALITARGSPAHERPIRTLREWGITVDEAFFLGGESKHQVIAAFKPDFFFDDQLRHLPGWQASGHVSNGVMNKGKFNK